MNDDIPTLFAFNRWANGKMLEACRQLTAEQYVAGPVPGWASVRFSVWHISVVTDGWLKCFDSTADPAIPTEEQLATVEDAAKLLATAHGRFEALQPQLTPEFLNTVRDFKRRRTLTLPIWVALRHIVNHTSYHRGQVASKLKRFGIQQPETDLALYAMETISQKVS